MFKRLIFDDYAAICTIVAFIVVAVIFLATLWRALRMPRQQTEMMANLPFEPNSRRHDQRD